MKTDGDCEMSESKPESAEDVKTMLGSEITKYLAISQHEQTIVIKPRQFLGRDLFGKIARKIREMGGVYVSAGKQSHFEIPLPGAAPLAKDEMRHYISQAIATLKDIINKMEKLTK